MENGLTETLTGGLEPQKLRRELQRGKSEKLDKRRAVIGLSLVGMAAMTAVSQFQTDIICPPS